MVNTTSYLIVLDCGRFDGMPVRNRIKQYLDSRGITPYRFRNDAGIAQRTAYDLYNNPSQIPSSTVLEKICTAYEIQPGVLLEWIKQSENNQISDVG
ncbi:MAG: hypothetical protein NVS2B14_01230 [Chamaesiphon sp.]